MANLNLRQDSPVDQLVVLVENLIDEALDIYSNISLEDLSTSSLNKLAGTILKNIDKADNVITKLEGIPSPEIIRCRLKLQMATDSLYKDLCSVKDDFANRVIRLECSGADLINYTDFCFNLSLKLVDRVSSAVLEGNKLPESEPVVINEELGEYL